MKSLLKMTLVSSIIVLSLAGCDNKADTTKTDKVVISTDEQKQSYALGALLANGTKNDLEKNEISLDSNYVINGFIEAYNGRSQQTEEEIKANIQALNKQVEEKADAKLEKVKNDNITAGAKFSEEFAKQDGVKKTPSGLLYKIEQEGTGAHPTSSSTVTVHYTGTLIDGRKFDSSYDNNKPATFPLNGVIKGWAEGIQLIGAGGKIKLVIPSDLAYGDQTIPTKVSIQPGSTLVFDVELLSIGDGNDQSESLQPKQ